MRAIDADALMDASKYEFWQDGSAITPIGEYILGKFRQLIRNMPTVTPEPQWIPCNERLPKDGTWNIFTDGKTISVERYKMDAIDHFFPQGRWFSFDKAIAWMPLPEPYAERKRRTDKHDDIFE